MSSKCAVEILLMSTIFIIIVNGYAKDITGVERGQTRLNEYISHYEILNYDHEHIRTSHNRAKRSVTKDHIVHLKFPAYGKYFHIRLKRDLNTFSDKIEFYDNVGPIDVSTDHIYEGEVLGDQHSYVFGSIHDGVFEGKIITERVAYYVEHAKRYFPTNLTLPTAMYLTAPAQNATDMTAATTTSSTTTTTPNDTKVNGDEVNGGFHSIIYKESHVDDPYKDVREGHAGGCGITDEVSEWMESIQNSAVEELPEPMSKDVDKYQRKMYKKRAPSDRLQDGVVVPDVRRIRDKFVNADASNEKSDNSNVNVNVNVDDADAVVDVNNDANVASTLHESNKKTSERQTKTASATSFGALSFRNEDKRNSHTNSNSNSSTSISFSSSSSSSFSPISGQWRRQRRQQEEQTKQQEQQQPLPKKYLINNNNNNNNKNRHNSDNINTNINNNNNMNYNNNDIYDIDDDFGYAPFEKYSREANFPFGIAGDDAAAEFAAGRFGAFYDPETGRRLRPGDVDWQQRVHGRIRRASGSASTASRREDNKNTCSLYIQTDPLIWRHIREGIADHDRGRKYEVDVKTREEITSLIAHHVTAVNYIYRNTKFDGRIEHRNIRFEVQRIKIDDDSACRSSYNGPHNAFCNEHMDVSNFLNLHSLEDHSDFCLAYVFTYRDFTGGTLGLAWVASASGASGGICEKYKTYTETVGGQYQSTKRSLNTGIITFVNYNSRVPPKVSQLTLAHEIGHNFGSPHDYPQECRPGGLNGNFIMFASATSGDRPNNSKFSPCSIRNISNVLDVLVGNLKRDCFKASEGAFCGNKIVESGEECDCGFNDGECKDNCCYPRIISEYDLALNSTATGCTRRAKTQCSPTQGPCCLANSCTFVPSNYHQKCKEETECSWSSTCNGTMAECPEPKPRDDKTKCNNGTALCIRGDCSGSICLLWNMSECFLTSQASPHVDKRRLCELACQNGNETATCRSTSEFAHLYGLPVGGISLRPGSPCDNFQGYCDVFLKCRAVDADGPLLRLKNLLLNRETLHTVAQWVTENWYLVVLMSISFVIVMGIFIKCCAVHTPSSNPKKRRARRISETLRAPMNTLRRMRHPHGRGSGPRSIPPPMHDQRSHQQRNHPPEWDRHNQQRGHGGQQAAVPLPAAGGSHASRPSGRAAGGRGSSRPTAANARAASNSRTSAPLGYAADPSVGGNGSGSRAPMPLPGTGATTVAASAPQQQMQLQAQPQPHPHPQAHPQAPYYAPKEHRNKSRTPRPTASAGAAQAKEPQVKAGRNRRNVVY